MVFVEVFPACWHKKYIASSRRVQDGSTLASHCRYTFLLQNKLVSNHYLQIQIQSDFVLQVEGEVKEGKECMNTKYK
jgi:hypothetical protein